MGQKNGWRDRPTPTTIFSYRIRIPSLHPKRQHHLTKGYHISPKINNCHIVLKDVTVFPVEATFSCLKSNVKSPQINHKIVQWYVKQMKFRLKNVEKTTTYKFPGRRHFILVIFTQHFFEISSFTCYFDFEHNLFLCFSVTHFFTSTEIREKKKSP